MTQQLDLMPGELVDGAVLERIAEQMPKPREVEPRLPLKACMHPVDAIKSVFTEAGIQVHPDQEARMRAVCDEQVAVKAYVRIRYPFGTDVGHELVLPERAREDHR